MRSSKRKMRLLSLVLFVVVGIVFLIPGIILYRKAFPEAVIDFKISRTQVLERGEEFLRGKGMNLAGYLRSIEFDYDFEAKIFLEREVGFERSKRLLADELRFWRWKARWFKPHEREEYQIFISPDGDLSGYDRILPEDAERKLIAQDEALSIAERFLADEAHIRLQDYALIERNFTHLEKRKDHIFTWEKAAFQQGDATYRITVTVQGDQVGAYREFLNVPDEWKRNYRRMTERNDLLQNITFLLVIPLLLAIPVTLLLRMRQRDVKWRIGIFLAATLFILYILQGINSIPIYLSSFDTSQSLGSFSGRVGVQTLFQALMYGIFIFIIACASEPLYREQFPQRLQMKKFFSSRFFRTEEFISAATAGYSLTLFHIGYVVLFYLLGRSIGVWSPAEVGYTDALSTFFPWIYPLTAGLTASLVEELIFRVFAISLLRKFLPTWVAVTIPAFLWGFLHSNYPQQPFFIRGIEVGLIGLLAGWVFLRWGFFATLIWHYSADAVFIGLFLFNSSNFYFIFSGILVIGLLVFPIFVSLIMITRKGVLQDESGLRNIDELPVMERIEGPSVQERIDGKQFLYFPLSRRKRFFLITIAVLSLALILFIRVSSPWGDARTSITPSQATVIAQEFLKKKDFDYSQFKSVVSFKSLTGSIEDRYIQNTEGLQGLRRAYEVFQDRYRWNVRFFIPMDEEEYHVSMNEQGREIVFVHIIPEGRKAPANTVERAQHQAEQFLKDEKNISLEHYALIDVSQDKKPNRIDYRFIWKWEKEKPASGEYRISVSVSGEEITGFSKSMKIPEEWKKKDEQEDLKTIIFIIIKTLLISAIGGFAVALFVRDFISRRIEWKRVVVAPLIVLSFFIIRELNRLPAIFEGYETSIAVSSFVTSRFISLVLQAGGVFISVCVISVAILALQREYDHAKSLIPDRGASPARYWKDALLCAPCFLILFLAGMRFYKWLNALIDIPRTSIAPDLLPGMDTFLPFLEVLSRSVIIASFLTPALYFGLFFFMRYMRRTINVYLLSVPATAAYVSNTVKSIPEFLLVFSAALVTFLICFHLMRGYLKNNVVACFLALVLIVSFPMAKAHLSLYSDYYRMNGIISLMLLVLLGFLSFFFMKRRRG